MKNENGDLLADSHNILNRWKNYFSQFLNVHGVSDVRQIEIHAAELLVPDLSPFEVDVATAKFRIYKSPGNEQVPKPIQQEVKYYGLIPINSLILFGIRNNCLISGRSLLLYQFVRRAIKLAVVIIVGYHCYQLRTQFYVISFTRS
jgi:hypothetical protein